MAEALVARDGLLDLGHLFPWQIARNIPAVFVTLVIVISALGTLADHADGSPVHALDLGDVMKDRFGSGFGIHDPEYIFYTYTMATKKREYPVLKSFVLRPLALWPPASLPDAALCVSMGGSRI